MISEPLESIRQWLAKRTGLSAASLGENWVRELVETRQAALDCGDLGVYAGHLFSTPAEQQEVIQSTLVHESWFFREPTAFAFLRSEVIRRAAAGRRWRLQPWRVLSMPCACGEEPYSIAMELLDAGLRPGEFFVEAADLSPAAIARARAGEYRRSAIREEPPAALRKGIEETEAGFRVAGHVRDLVRFHVDNAISPSLAAALPLFDAIFCRNLLVYLTPAAREQVVDRLSAMLRREGLLFFGHADLDQHLMRGLRKVGSPGAFAYQLTAHPVSSGSQGGVTPRPARMHFGGRISSRRAGELITPRNGASGAGLELPLKPKPVRRTLQEAERMANVGATAAALALVEEILRTEPLNGQAWALAGSLHLANGNGRFAETAFRKALYLMPDDQETLLQLALLAEEAGRSDEANRLRRRLARSQPEEAP